MSSSYCSFCRVSKQQFYCKLTASCLGHSWHTDSGANGKGSSKNASSVEDSLPPSAKACLPGGDVVYCSEREKSSHSVISSVCFLNMGALSSAIYWFYVCSSCRKGQVEMYKNKQRRQGFVSICVLRCTFANCGEELVFPLSSRKLQQPPLNTNIRTSLGIRLPGSWGEGLKNFAIAMEMPPPAKQPQHGTTKQTDSDFCWKTGKAVCSGGCEWSVEIWTCQWSQEAQSWQTSQ